MSNNIHTTTCNHKRNKIGDKMIGIQICVKIHTIILHITTIVQLAI